MVDILILPLDILHVDIIDVGGHHTVILQKQLERNGRRNFIFGVSEDILKVIDVI